jgi:hypothetical protein
MGLGTACTAPSPAQAQGRRNPWRLGRSGKDRVPPAPPVRTVDRAEDAEAVLCPTSGRDCVGTRRPGRRRRPELRRHLSARDKVPSHESLARGQAIFHLSADSTRLDYKRIAVNIDHVVFAQIHLAPAGELPLSHEDPRLGDRHLVAGGIEDRPDPVPRRTIRGHGGQNRGPPTVVGPVVARVGEPPARRSRRGRDGWRRSRRAPLAA